MIEFCENVFGIFQLHKERTQTYIYLLYQLRDRAAASLLLFRPEEPAILTFLLSHLSLFGAMMLHLLRLFPSGNLESST